MGAAVPWRFYFKWYGGKSNQIQAVADSIAGTKRCLINDGLHQSIDWRIGSEAGCTSKNSVWDIPEACFLAQPMQLNANDIGTIQSGYPNPTIEQSKAIKKLVNKKSVGIGDTYLIVPFEGCGGDGITSKQLDIPDVANSCFGSIESNTDLIDALNGEFTNISTADYPKCQGLRALWDEGEWEWNSNVYENFKNYSSPLGLDPNNGYNGQKASDGGHLNWCSGANMHFDIGMDTPLWENATQDITNKITQTNARSNIFMRYKRHRCVTPSGDNNIDVKAPPMPGGYVACPPPYSDGVGVCAKGACGDSASCMCEVGMGSGRHGCCLSGVKEPALPSGTCAALPTGPCSGSACKSNTCRSSRGYCGGKYDQDGNGDDWCNSESIWTPACQTDLQAETPQANIDTVTNVPTTESSSDTQGSYTYGNIAKRACDQVAKEIKANNPCGDSCKSIPDTKTAMDIARIWSHGTAGMLKESNQPINGGIESCIGAVAVALGECQASANITDVDNGGCSNKLSVAMMSGGIWQQSGPLTTDVWNRTGSTTVDGTEIDCTKHAKAADADTTNGGFGPSDTDLDTGPRSPVCQARLAFAKVGASGGCGLVKGADTIPQCYLSPFHATGTNYLNYANDYNAEQSSNGNPCWADALCVTGIKGDGQWPGASPANGQTNSYGHYFQSCANTNGKVFDGNPVSDLPANWTVQDGVIDNGLCAPDLTRSNVIS